MSSDTPAIAAEGCQKTLVHAEPISVDRIKHELTDGSSGLILQTPQVETSTGAFLAPRAVIVEPDSHLPPPKNLIVTLQHFLI